MPRYNLTISFDTDRLLSEDELGQIQSVVIAQIEEPTDAEGADVDYSTSLYGCDILKVNN
jgi:hypothetical protein